VDITFSAIHCAPPLAGTEASLLFGGQGGGAASGLRPGMIGGDVGEEAPEGAGLEGFGVGVVVGVVAGVAGVPEGADGCAAAVVDGGPAGVPEGVCVGVSAVEPAEAALVELADVESARATVPMGPEVRKTAPATMMATAPRPRRTERWDNDFPEYTRGLSKGLESVAALTDRRQ